MAIVANGLRGIPHTGDKVLGSIQMLLDAGISGAHGIQ